MTVTVLVVAVTVLVTGLLLPVKAYFYKKATHVIIYTSDSHHSAIGEHFNRS